MSTKKKLKFSVIGLRVGEVVAAHVLKHPKAELRGICDIDEKKLKELPEKWGADIPVKTTDYKDLVSDPDTDVIVVASPDHFHREQAIAALEAGKHVFCEKPLALTMEDCNAIIDAEAKAVGKFFVGQVCRFAPGFAKAKELVDRGVLGELFLVESEYAHDYSFMGTECWRSDPKINRYGFVGGGCHAVDLVRWFAGNPTEVSAYGNQKCLTDWPPTMDAVMAIYQLPKNTIGKVFCSTGCKRPYTMRTVIYGTKGTIICDNTSSNIQVYSTDWLNPSTKEDNTGFVNIPVAIDSHGFGREIDTFIDALEHGADIELNAREGTATVNVCLATVESAQTQKPVKINY